MEFMSCPFCKNFIPDEEMLEVTFRSTGADGSKKEVVKDICPACAKKLAEEAAAQQKDGAA